MRNRSNLKGVLLYLCGLFLCTGPVLAAIFSYFPLWREMGGGRLLSGGTLALVILAWVPLAKAVKRIIASPASYVMWFLIFLLFLVLSRIADEMTVISFVGFLGNLLGAVCFKFAKRMKPEDRR